ncbi:signaling protein [Streptomyces sp. NPDC051577]|uniref:phage baseplate protein n=1 Tax=Streptomyces sp. NPDC051577 TaxID=3155166 RepID=UPI003431FCA0
MCAVLRGGGGAGPSGGRQNIGMADDTILFSRRTLMFGGGAVAAGLAAAGLTWALAPEPDEPAREEPDPQPTAGDFDMRTGAELLAATPLFNTTGPQSFAFDDANGLVYTLQTIQSGIQLEDESAPLTSGDRKTAGDMCLTRLSSTGISLGHMYLRGFGHGISFGVEPVGKHTYIWVESRPDEDSGYGTVVARVLFDDGGVVDGSDRRVPHYDPVPGASDVSPALDLAGGRVLVSHEIDGEHRLSVYRMADFLAGRFDPVHVVRAGVQVKEEEWFQGCALHGNFVYILTGRPYTTKDGNNPRKSGGNTHVSAIDIRTGRAQGRHKVTVAPDLPFREPEGMAIGTADSRPALCVGFSVKAEDRRELTVYRFTG